MYGLPWVAEGASGAARWAVSGWDWRLLTERGPMQMGHWKQLRVHLGAETVLSANCDAGGARAELTCCPRS